MKWGSWSNQQLEESMLRLHVGQQFMRLGNDRKNPLLLSWEQGRWGCVPLQAFANSYPVSGSLSERDIPINKLSLVLSAPIRPCRQMNLLVPCDARLGAMSLVTICRVEHMPRSTQLVLRKALRPVFDSPVHADA
jgi:hypothetical protein